MPVLSGDLNIYKNTPFLMKVRARHLNTKNMKRVIVCKCLGAHEASYISPLYAPVHITNDPPQFLQLRTYLMDALFLSQKTNSNIRRLCSLKYKHSEKECILYEEIKLKKQ